MERFYLVLRAGFLKNRDFTLELMIYDKYKGKNTGPQCVNVYCICDHLLLDTILKNVKCASQLFLIPH
jgi:hypothetical protein